MTESREHRKRPLYYIRQYWEDMAFETIHSYTKTGVFTRLGPYNHANYRLRFLAGRSKLRPILTFDKVLRLSVVNNMFHFIFELRVEISLFILLLLFIVIFPHILHVVVLADVCMFECSRPVAAADATNYSIYWLV